MKNGHPNLKNALRLAIRGNVILSDEDLDRIEDWVKTEREIRKIEDEMRMST